MVRGKSKGEVKMKTVQSDLMRKSTWLLATLALSIALGACTTSKRAAQLVIDHHLGMAQGAMDIMSGKAEEREQRVATLQANLEASRAAVAAEQDQGRLLERLKEHAALQDALIAEIMQGHGQHGGHQHAQAEAKPDEQPAHAH